MLLGKSRRAVRSILAAEVYAVSEFHGYCYTLAYELCAIHGRKILIYLITDAKLIFDKITEHSGMNEKRLMIDITALRQSYPSGEITNFGHVSPEFNLADRSQVPSISILKLAKLHILWIYGIFMFLMRSQYFPKEKQGNSECWSCNSYRLHYNSLSIRTQPLQFNFKMTEGHGHDKSLSRH